MKKSVFKKIAAAIAAGAMITTLFSGCNTATENEDRDTMYLWDKSMTRELTPWLREQFPDIDFTFVVGYNSMEFYTDLAARGALPDIITCRRFSLNDAAHLSDMLMDLSQTNAAGSFYDSYIDNNREPGGAVRWLPMCAEVDGYIANVDLFEKYAVAADAIAASKHGYYDLVLMDIQMPVMNGYEATKSIRALEDSVLAAVPIVAMTANAFDEDRKTAKESGMNGFISKPINMEEVIEVLNSVLNKE